MQIGKTKPASRPSPTKQNVTIRKSNKVEPPSVATLQTVPRISGRLDLALRKSVVWVQGPPGAGKTTSVARHVADATVDTMWLRVDADDSDPATFFAYLREAAALRRDDAGLPVVRPEYMSQPAAFARRFFRELFDPAKPGYLVLDDYGEIPAASPVHDLLVEGLAQMADCHRVLVVSREPPPAAFARLRVHGDLEILPADLLSLTIGETQDIASRRALAVDGDMLAAIVDKTHGWAAGLILMLEATGEARTGGGAAVELPEVLFDYFAGEIFDRLSIQDRRSLMLLALAPSLPLGTVAALAGNVSAVTLVEDLVRRSYFTVSSGSDGERQIRFHGLFRDFLLRQGIAFFTEPCLRVHRTRVAVVLEACGQTSAAASIYAELRDWIALAKLIRTTASALARQGRFAVLTAWLDLLPSEVVLADGWLSYWAATARAAIVPKASRPMYRHALTTMRRDSDVAGVLLSWSGLANTIIDDPGSNQAELDADIALFAELIADVDTFPGVEVEFRVALTIYLALNRRSPDRSLMRLWRDRALAAAASIGLPGPIISMRCYIALYALIDGDYATAREQFEVIPPASALVREPLLQAIIFVAQGLAQMYAQIPGRCERTAEEAMAASHESGIYLWTHVHAALEAVAEGDISRGRLWLRRTAQLTGKVSVYHGPHYQMVSTYVAALAGDGEGAIRSGVLAVEMTVADGWFLYEIIARIGLAQAYESTGRIGAGFAELDRADAAARRVAAGSTDVSLLFLKADFVIQHVGLTEGREVLRAAFDWAERTGARRTLLSPFRNARLCALALENDFHTDRAKAFIAASGLEPPDANLESWPWTFVIRTLGRFEVLRDGEPLKMSRKTPRRLMSLLKAIVALGGTEVPNTVLVDMVWPDEDGDAGHRALEVALYRLRRLLGDTDVLISKAGRIGIDRRRCWIDADAFERGLARAGDAAARLRTLAIYRGEFLHGDDEPWIVTRRRRLEALHAKAVRRLED